MTITSLIAAVALSAGGGFRSDYPAAAVVESASGQLTSAFGFEVTGLGATPEAAAQAFLAKYGEAFGVTPRQQLVLRGAPAQGQSGAVRFERRIDGVPVFDGDVIVGVDARPAVILVNVGDVPAAVTGRARLTRTAAIRAATRSMQLGGAVRPRAERGWRAVGAAVRPVWRVEFTATTPRGDWRSDVDAETGTLLMRVNLRAGDPPRARPPHQTSAPLR